MVLFSLLIYYKNVYLKIAPLHIWWKENSFCLRNMSTLFEQQKTNYFHQIITADGFSGYILHFIHWPRIVYLNHILVSKKKVA